MKNGTTLHELKELGGWTDLASVLIYAQLGSQHLSKRANLPTCSATLLATGAAQEIAEAA